MGWFIYENPLIKHPTWSRADARIQKFMQALKDERAAGAVELPPGRLSPHFKEAEFACRHCGKLDKYPPQKLLDFLEDIRTHFGAPININSGYRCPVHNKDVGGATQSRHMVGDAADFHSKGASPAELFRYSDKLVGDAGGVSEYDTFVHIDVRGSKARW